MFGHVDAGGSVRIEQVAVLFVVALDGGERALRVGRAGDDFEIHVPGRIARNGHAAFQREPGHQAGDFLGILADLVVEPALEVAGDLDVHGGVDGGDDLALGVDARVEEPGEDVVLVRGEDQPADGQAHALGVPARENVAEIAGGHRELDLRRAGFLAHPEGGEEVVHDLAEDARPVDGIDRAQRVRVLERQVAEQGLHDELAVVEAALDRQVEHVGVEDGRHLALLQVADAAVRMHDEDVDALLAAHAADGGGARVAAGGREDVEAAVAFFEDFLEQAAEELEGDVLEGQGGTVEELEDMEMAHLAHGADVGMGEGAVGRGDQFLQAGFGDVVGEQADDFKGQFGIIEILPGVQLGGDIGDAVGDEQAAVAGKAGHDGILERERRLGAAGADVADRFHNSPGIYRPGAGPWQAFRGGGWNEALENWTMDGDVLAAGMDLIHPRGKPVGVWGPGSRTGAARGGLGQSPPGSRARKC